MTKEQRDKVKIQPACLECMRQHNREGGSNIFSAFALGNALHCNNCFTFVAIRFELALSVPKE